MTETLFGHEIEREVTAGEVYYECVECGLRDDLISAFERYTCDEYRHITSGLRDSACPCEERTSC